MSRKRIGIWIRVSTDMQVRDESPEHHEKRGRLYAEAKEWEVAEIYRLDAVSGKSVIDHPEARRMLDDIRRGHVTALIFSKLARLARNTKELLEFSEIFRQCNADLVSLSESIDTSTPSGRLFYTMIAAMAEWERAEIAERVAASVPIRAKLGKPLGGAASFGYRWQGSELVLDETEAPIRKLMYELFLQNRRKKATASELNRLGYRTRGNAKFTGTTVTRLLHDPTAKGERRANYTRSLGEGKSWVTKPENEWVIVPCPAIITRELWQQCSDILMQQERKNNRIGPRVAHLLAGFVHCQCGEKMYVTHSNNVYRCKKCKTRIPSADLDEIFHMQLQSFLMPEKASYREQSVSVLAEKKQLLQASTVRLAELKKKSSHLIGLRLDGLIELGTFVEEHKPVEAQVAQLGTQVAELQAQVDFLSVQSLSATVVLDEAKALYDKWESLAFEEKRSIVEVITEKITIGNTDVTISLAYQPYFSETAEEGNAAMPLWLLQPSRQGVYVSSRCSTEVPE